MMNVIISFLNAILSENRRNYLIEKLFSRSLKSASSVKEMQSLSDLASKMVLEADDQKRVAQSANTRIPELKSYDGSSQLSVQIMPTSGCWLVPSDFYGKIPGMISREEELYYLYIGAFYQGKGELVEIGPWLGRSTSFICEGLKLNPNFKDKKLHVYDDFVWRPDWMDSYVPDNEKQGRHTDFQPLFEKYTSAISDKLEVRKQKFSVFDGNDNVPDLVWDGKKIEVIYADCGRIMESNNKWYNMLKPFFIPGVTMIVLQDWRLYREIPILWYNQTKQFTESLAHELTQVHEVSDGGVSMFLYTPKAG